ncbi:MAG: aminotransferase class I/II-fold pyridoxal phosphate-dependent enzyme [Candidatus Lokiarchaeota archaeon]|nr:aminotransferase class I/II-fold pyridoxal phosphate-dependent enzyme [Candidatus Lokiarchaeota archaeon]MBD3198540.1 aminotransferase class I/II-fold pyridoxal phosphate-dependent enzyme [Candidatus Lokiarchaeota archaeon]
MEYAERVGRLPKYIFAAIEELTATKRKEGIDFIPLGIGDPDLTTPDVIIEELIKQVQVPKNQNYPTSMGEEDFRSAVSKWYKVRFGLDFDIEKEVTNVLGGKEGVANIARAFVNPGDIVLCPNPGYPVYANGATKLCDGEPYLMPLKKENDFLPDLESIESSILKKARMMYLNYPNNPTGAIITEEFLRKAIDYAEDYDFMIVYDNPYSEFTFDDYIAPTLLQYSKDHVEINSASKMFCMTGFRCGWAVGNEEIIAGLRKIKSQIDSGCPQFIQRAVIIGLNEYKSNKKPQIVEENMKIYERRRDVLIEGLNKIGWTTEKPQATFYVWTAIPSGEKNSMEFVKKLINVGVIITPGTGFGQYGERFVRFALTQPIERIKEALERIEKVF